MIGGRLPGVEEPVSPEKGSWSTALSALGGLGSYGWMGGTILFHLPSGQVVNEA